MIPIRNIYYMLSYAFSVLREKEYEKVLTEEFENVYELCAEILLCTLSVQIKQGLRRGYIDFEEPLSSPKGKIEITGSLKSLMTIKHQLICSYDLFSTNIYENRIIKSTVNLLLGLDISKDRKKKLRQLILHFNDVDLLDIHRTNWNIRYDRNSASYRMIVGVCRLVIDGMIQSETTGQTKLMTFFDESRMCNLYERFIREYYRYHYPELHAEASQIKWALEGESNDYLPDMKTDVTLTKGDKTLIIDAKYYSHIYTINFGKESYPSANLYQIFSYVKNYQANNPNKEVAGMLLYAKTNETSVPDSTYNMTGNQISIKTLDLNVDFTNIANQLNKIAEDYFNL